MNPKGMKNQSGKKTKYQPKLNLNEGVEFDDLISLSLGKKPGQAKVKAKKKTTKKKKTKR